MNYAEELREIVGHRPLILVGSVTVVMDDKKRLLLQKRKTPYGVWGLPGGLMELGESTEDTARREVKEEVGLTIGKLTLVDIFSGKDNYLKVSNGDEFYAVTALYYTEEVAGQLIVDEKESLGFSFFQMNNLPDNIVKSHRRMLDRFFEVYDKKGL